VSYYLPEEVITIKINISVAEAQEIVLSRVSPLPCEEISLDTALDRIIAEDIYALKSLPHFSRVMVDGYALRSVDTDGKCVKLFKIIGDLPAGQVADQTVKPGTCFMVMTGSPLPEGADAVIRREEVHVWGTWLLYIAM